MELKFSKYQGTGNDFILFDDRELTFPQKSGIVQQLCDRKFGIGADGVILIQEHPSLDYRMVYFNSDGSQSLCGNGSRCGFAFAEHIGMVHEKATFETTDGIHQIHRKDGNIHFQLFDVKGLKKLNDSEWYVNTGSPHHIILSDQDLEHIDLVSRGREIRNNPSYSSQNGTNVNFAQLLQDHVKIRTYERGVEDETLSCGTGATAVGLVAGNLGYNSPISIVTKGGKLQVAFKKEGELYTEIWLSGPAENVFEGSVTI